MTARGKMVKGLGGVEQIDVWENGDYVHAQSGEGPDDWVIAVSSPVRGSGLTVKSDARLAKSAVRRAIEEIRSRA